MRELVDHAQHPELAAIVRPILDEVIGPQQSFGQGVYEIVYKIQAIQFSA